MDHPSKTIFYPDAFHPEWALMMDMKPNGTRYIFFGFYEGKAGVIFSSDDNYHKENQNENERSGS